MNYDGDDVEDVFCLNFVGAYEAYGENIEVPLIPNGKDISVTHLNKREYVERYANFVMNSSISDVRLLFQFVGSEYNSRSICFFLQYRLTNYHLFVFKYHVAIRILPSWVLPVLRRTCPFTLQTRGD